MIKILIKKRVEHNKKYPFRILTNRAFYDKRLSPMAKILLMHLLGSGKNYTPTISLLAKQLSTSESDIDRSISKLRKYGYLTSTSIGGKKHGVQSWWIYEIPDYMDSTDTNTDAGCNSTDTRNDSLTDTNTDALYQDIDCGGIHATPQSTNEEKKIVLPPKPFNEMSEEELNNYFPF